MKMKIIIIAVTLVVLGGAAFVVASGGEDVNEGALNAMRGTDPYYIDAEPVIVAAPYGGGELLVNIQGQSALQIAFEIEYRVGKRWQMADPNPAADNLAKIASALRSKLIMEFSGRTKEAFSGAMLKSLPQELIGIINEMAFPNEEARVETVHLTKVFVQASS